MLTARRLGVPFGFSAHAKDIRTAGRSALTERAQEATCVIACNPDTAGELEALGANVALMPHGVDIERFRPINRRPGDSDPFRLLAVGRLVAKKGFDVLIDAVAGLNGRLPLDLRIVGDGPERGRLLDRISRYRLNESVKLEASLTHGELPAKYAWADAVVVPSVTDRTGDRDGLPNVVLEAMASGRPVLATDAGAISAAVHPHQTGLLVAPGDPDGLKNAIRLLAEDPSLRHRLGRTAGEAA